jgi:hypothetical protein
VFEPAKQNGAAILSVVSFGYFSNLKIIEIFYFLCQSFLDHGYTVIAVLPGSQPRYIVKEIQADTHRAIRFVQRNVSSFGGEKTGHHGRKCRWAHLKMIGTQGKPGSSLYRRGRWISWIIPRFFRTVPTWSQVLFFYFSESRKV